MFWNKRIIKPLLVLNQMVLESSSKFEVFFDGKCPLCRREIDMIRRKDKEHRLTLTDIADPSFESTDVPFSELMAEIHGRNPDGSYVKGVEVFRQIYSRIGFESFVKLSRLPLVGTLLDCGYHVFAKIRYWSAKRRIAQCDTLCGPTK